MLFWKKQVYITELGDELKKIENGDFFKPLKTFKDSKFLAIANSINGILQQIRKLIALTTTSARQFKNLAYDFYNVVLETSRDSEELVLRNRVSFEKNEKKLKIATGTYARMEEIQGQADLIKAKIGNLDSMSGVIKKTANDNKVEFDELRRNAKATSALEKENIKNMKALRMQSEKITEIVSDISKIAGQTNLLALNANIEAARAGEHGKGFAVVADEIRKLANQSALVAESVKKMIEDTIELTSNAVGASENVSASMTRMNLSINKTIESTDVMLDTVFSMDDGLKDMSEAIESQNGAIEEVTTSAHELAEFSVEAMDYSKENINTAESINDRVSGMSVKTENLVELSKGLNNMIEKMVEKGRSIDKKTQQEIEMSKDVLVHLSKNPVFVSEDKKLIEGEIKKYFKTNSGDFSLVVLIDKEGFQFTSDIWGDESKNKNLGQGDYFGVRNLFKNAMKGKIYISEPKLSSKTYNLVVEICVPIENNNGEIVGVLMGSRRLHTY